MYLYHANDKNDDEYFSSHHIPVEGLAMERLSVKSKTKRRLSLARPPQSPRLPGKSGADKLHA